MNPEITMPRPKSKPKPELLLDAPKSELQSLVFYPDRGLKKRSETVTDFGDELLQLVSDLAFTMYSIGGVGLSAPQIGILKRVFICDILAFEKPSPKLPKSQLLIAVNPEIVMASDGKEEEPESCLSFPGVQELVKRPKEVLVHAQDHRGEPWSFEISDTLGRVIQHEVDHLDGITFLQRMSLKARKRALRKIKSKGGIKNHGLAGKRSKRRG